MAKITIMLLLCGTLTAYSQNTRYLHRVFPAVTKSADIVYGNAPALVFPYLLESLTSNTDLTMDIFQPTGDTATSRPLIVFIHSGAFLTGSKENEDMQALCDSFAHRGYVTASINYRQNFNVLSSNSAERAVYRGLQDAAAAIRYMKAFRTTYKIDTSRIFSLGSSAGGFSALNLAYLDNSERPASTFNSPNLGCIDCAGNAYPHNHRLKAFASCWGAIGNTTWINQSNNNVPAILFHGDADGTVPYDQGHPFGYPIFPIVYGSLPIDQRLTAQSITHEFYTGVGEDHEYWGTCNGAWCPSPTPFYIDIVYKTALFFYNQINTAPLPLDLVDFHAIKNGEVAALSWTTAHEQHVCCFDVERSTDAVSFNTIATKTAVGNSTNTERYQLEDASPVPGVNYYRLKQLDKDGHFTWSPTVAVHFRDAQFAVYPNPTTGVFAVKADEMPESGIISITNALGQLVMNRPLTTGTIDLTGYPAGKYLVRIESDHQIVHKQLILTGDSH